ncbi:MAG TPA: hypothetical protein VFQ05_13155 [Candidatus Eisenbacteria bacterium]|nr:hypothetical protein [Candidatus Eisenbacteria bacterium]
MAHAYTPGLKVTEHAVLRRERRLPLKGQVLVKASEHVSAKTIVARTELPGNVQTVNIAAKLAIDPAKVPESLVRPIGSSVEAGELIASGRSLFGLMQQKATAPSRGTLESVSGITGQLILREPPIPVEVDAFVEGRVLEVLPEEGVVVETEGTFIQGIFGVGGETQGEIAVVNDSPTDELRSEHLSETHRGKIVVGGTRVSHATLMRAKSLGVAAVVVGGFDDRDLRLLLGRDLGVAITGSEDLGITLLLTEGFGPIPMADRTWKLLKAREGHAASVSGATQIRAGVMRPEIIVPTRGEVKARKAAAVHTGVEVGSLLRVIRQPHFGRIGTVVDLPPELNELESGSKARVMIVEFVDDRSRAVVPRANVELIEA